MELAVVHVGVVVDLILLVDVAHSGPKFDYVFRLYERFDAVREWHVLAVAILVQVALRRVEGGQDDRLGLAVLEDAVLSRV